MFDVEALVRSLLPRCRILAMTPLKPDVAEATSDGTHKIAGYGVPVRVTVVDDAGAEHELVVHTATADDYGHDRRADRAEEMILAWDTFRRVPRHTRALDVGFIGEDGRPISIKRGGEPYLVTTWAPGTPYAEDLRRIAHTGEAAPLDLERCDALARYLLALHDRPGTRPACYRRALRDLIGHGEGIYGVIDGYPADTPAAPPERLQAIERACAEFRWKLRGKEHRLVATHGDFHPFNVVFDAGAALTVLDAARGGQGDRADDVTAMAVNFVFFAAERPAAWRDGLGVLWRRFWRVYLSGSPDTELLETVPPFLAWRALVVASPSFYPDLTAAARDKILGLAERALGGGRFHPEWAEEIYP